MCSFSAWHKSLQISSLIIKKKCHITQLSMSLFFRFNKKLLRSLTTTVFSYFCVLRRKEVFNSLENMLLLLRGFNLYYDNPFIIIKPSLTKTTLPLQLLSGSFLWGGNYYPLVWNWVLGNDALSLVLSILSKWIEIL